MDLNKLKHHSVIIIKITGCCDRAGGAATTLAGVVPTVGIAGSGSFTRSAKSKAPCQRESGLGILSFVIL